MRMHWSRRKVLLVAVLWSVAWFSCWKTQQTATGAEIPTVKIKRQAVMSTSLASVGYSERFRLLEIEFLTGEIYRYEAVPVAIYEDLFKAESKGRYFMERIRGKFPFQHIRKRAR